MLSVCLSVLSVFVATVASQDVASQFSENVSNCLGPETTSAEYNACLLTQVRMLQPYLPKGIPELNIPPMDPLAVRNINFDRVEPPVSIMALFKNLRISGLQDMDIRYLEVDIFGEGPRTMRMGFSVPTMIMRGQYEIDGNIFLLPIQGKGNFISKLDSVIMEGSADIVQTGEGIKTSIENLNVGFKIKSMASKLDNLFEGNQVLSDTLHHFLNSNGQLILDEIRPGLTNIVNELLSGLFIAVFDAAPDILHAQYRGPGSNRNSGALAPAQQAPAPSQQAPAPAQPSSLVRRQVLPRFLQQRGV